MGSVVMLQLHPNESPAVQPHVLRFTIVPPAIPPIISPSYTWLSRH